MLSSVIRQSLLTTLLLISLSAATLRGQSSEVSAAVIQRLDSLLIGADWPGFRSSWESLSRRGVHPENEAAQQYRDLYVRLTQIDSISPARTDTLCREFRALEARFTPEQCGSTAATLFQRFRTTTVDSKEALRIYSAAAYFRTAFLLAGRNNYLAKEANAERMLKAGELDSVRAVLDAFPPGDQTSPSFLMVRDTLRMLYERLERQWRAAAEVRFVERQTEPVKKIWTLSATGGAMAYMRPKEYDGTLMYTGFRLVFIPAFSVRFAGSLEAAYYFTPRIAAGIAGGFGTMYSDSLLSRVLPILTVRTFINQRFSLLQGYGVYYFRGGEGVRAYARLGAGEMTIHRDSVKVTSQYPVRYTPIGAEDVMYPIFTLETGAECELGTHFPVYLGLYCGVMNHFGDARLIHHFIVTSGMRAGVSFF